MVVDILLILLYILAKKIMLFVKLIQFASIYCATTLLNQSIVNLLKRKHQKMYLQYICKLIWKVLSAISFEQNKTYITGLLELGLLFFLSWDSSCKIYYQNELRMRHFKIDFSMCYVYFVYILLIRIYFKDLTLNPSLLFKHSIIVQ